MYARDEVGAFVFTMGALIQWTGGAERPDVQRPWLSTSRTHASSQLKLFTRMSLASSMCTH